MKLYFEEYTYLTEEDLLEASAKTDFRDKFGQKALDNFDKARQRLKNNGMSVDYGQYLKMEPDELDNLILSLYDDKKDAQKKRILQGKDKEIRGKYNYIGEYSGFKIYEPLDFMASMDLGVNTGWCTTGRYGHAGHPEYTPSEKDAKMHFDSYVEDGIRLFYFLNPKTMYGEYAVAVYPEMLEVKSVIGGEYIYDCDFEVFNSKDNNDYSAIHKLPMDKLPVQVTIHFGYGKVINGLAIDEDEGVLVKVDKNLTSVEIPIGISIIGDSAFEDCDELTSVKIPEGVTEIYDCAFYGCSKLKSIEIPQSVTYIGNFVFADCFRLSSIKIPRSLFCENDGQLDYEAIEDLDLPYKCKVIPY